MRSLNAVALLTKLTIQPKSERQRRLHHALGRWGELTKGEKPRRTGGGYLLLLLGLLLLGLLWRVGALLLSLAGGPRRLEGGPAGVLTRIIHGGIIKWTLGLVDGLGALALVALLG